MISNIYDFILDKNCLKLEIFVDIGFIGNTLYPKSLKNYYSYSMPIGFEPSHQKVLRMKIIVCEITRAANNRLLFSQEMDILLQWCGYRTKINQMIFSLFHHY